MNKRAEETKGEGEGLAATGNGVARRVTGAGLTDSVVQHIVGASLNGSDGAELVNNDDGDDNKKQKNADTGVLVTPAKLTSSSSTPAIGKDATVESTNVTPRKEEHHPNNRGYPEEGKKPTAKKGKDERQQRSTKNDDDGVFSRQSARESMPPEALQDILVKASSSAAPESATSSGTTCIALAPPAAMSSSTETLPTDPSEKSSCRTTPATRRGFSSMDEPSTSVGAYRVAGIGSSARDQEEEAKEEEAHSQENNNNNNDDDDAVKASNNYHRGGAYTEVDNSIQSFDTHVIAAVVHEDGSEELRKKETLLEEQIRNRLLEETVDAHAVMPVNSSDEDKQEQGISSQSSRLYHWLTILGCVLLVAVIVLAVLLSSNGNDGGDQNDNGRGQVMMQGVDDFPIETSGTNNSGSAATTPPPLVSSVGIAVAPPIGNPTAGPTGETVSNNNNNNKSTIETIAERGFLRCGIIFDTDGVNAGNIESINISQCRALSVAIFGNPDQIEITKLSSSRKQALVTLASGSVDVLTALTTRDMLRDVFEPDPQAGFTFAVTYAYIGAVFAGVPEFVDCAEKLDASTGICRDLKVCTYAGSTFELILTDKILRGVEVLGSQDRTEMWEMLNNNACNVAFADTTFIPQSQRMDVGNVELPDYRIGTKFFSRDNCGCTTRDDDPEWSSLVNLVMDAFYTAEALNISKSNPEVINEYLPTSPELASMLVSIVSELGNFGDINRDFKHHLPRKGLQRLYDKSHNGTGLLRSFALGTTTSPGPGPFPNQTLDKIIKRDRLICGVSPRPGFATIDDGDLAEGNETQWVGFDVEVCRGLAAALLRDGKDKVTFVNVSASNDRYRLLKSREVDVVAGSRVSLEAAYKEPSTGRGYTFSLPYYYDDGTRDAYAMMSRNDDPQWSDFVFWVVNALIYAEENQISQSNPQEMDVVFLFGGKLKLMLVDVIMAVGNWGEIHNRTLAPMLPRAPPNILNDGTSPQQFPLPFR